MNRVRIKVVLENAAGPISQAEFTVAAGTPLLRDLSPGWLIDSLVARLVATEVQRVRREAAGNLSGIDQDDEEDFGVRLTVPL